MTELVISVFTFLGFIRLSRYFKGGIAIFTMAFLLLVFNYTLNAMRQECAISICFLHFHICGKRNGFLIYVGLLSHVLFIQVQL